MTLRNKVVARLGLKDLGTLDGFDASKPANQYKTGDRMGLFALLENHANEVVMGDSDKHLGAWRRDGGGNSVVLPFGG